jgi:hypothetical protein
MVGSLIASPPRARWPVAELAWSVSGAALVVLCWGALQVGVVVGFVCCALGVVFGWRVLRRMLLARAFNSEWTRAKAEWTTLSRGAAEAKLLGQATEDYLRERGYRVPGVVGAIAHDLSLENSSE